MLSQLGTATLIQGTGFEDLTDNESLLSDKTTAPKQGAGFSTDAKVGKRDL